MKHRERIVWSPENGGCLMWQRRIDGKWTDWASQEEGQYPQHDERSRHAVLLMNRMHRAAALHERASRLETKARVLRDQALRLVALSKAAP